MRQLFAALSLMVLLLAVVSSLPASNTPKFKPYVGQPRVHPFPPQSRNVVINLEASKNATDDVPDQFLSALQKANHGGKVVLAKGKTFVIGKKLDLTFLDNVYVQLDGEILFTNDTTYWQADANHFYHPFQKSITFWQWGGKNIKLYGKGTINGNGQAWYDGFAGREILNPNNTYLRPNLFTILNAEGFYIEGITFKNSPCWTTFSIDSKNITFKDVDIVAHSSNKNLPKNTDGFDTYNVDGLTVLNTNVDIGDDCFSPKPNTTNHLAFGLTGNPKSYTTPTGTHGVSMGSIGQYAGVKDIIENVFVEDVYLSHGQNGARLKSWGGIGHGYGYINNITFKNFQMIDTDSPIVIDSCYFNIPAAECAAHPSQVNITNVSLQNFRGTSSGSRGRIVSQLTCSPAAVCKDIHLSNIHIESPVGEPAVFVCDGVTGDTGYPCVSINSTIAKDALSVKLPGH
ncbi:hypothetical protein HDV00_010947 [Rhizophlyctis rosea]|nr:hypothetical protein HDV00_010947 [Rhizophlyctis rosea]